MPTLRAALSICAVIATSAGSVANAETQPPTPGISAQDRSFLVEAHQGNLAEISAGTLAKEKGKAEQVRSIGAVLVADHTKLDNALKAAAAKLDLSLPSRPSPKQMAQHDGLAAVSGPAFDRAWVEAMIKDHRMALASGDKELRAGSSPEAKRVAASSAPVIKAHLSRLLWARGATEQPTGSPGPARTAR